MSQNIKSDSNHHLIENSSLSVTDIKPKNSRKSGKNSNKANDRRHRRPDMKLYVPPKAKGNSSADETEDQSSAQNYAKKTSETIESLSELEISDSSHPKVHNRLTSCSNDCIESHKCKDMTASDDSNPQLTDNKINNKVVAEENSWDSLFDDNGDCIRPEFVDRVNDLISNKDCDLKLEKTRIDYFNFQYNEHEFDNSEFPHILEVYDFPIDLKTQDIITSISVFNSRDFDVKWVDDSHALIVFSNANAATEALKFVYPNIKLRPLSQAIRESKVKARKCSEFLQPYKQRPQTSASLARRLVTQSLGLRERISPEQRAAERKKLAEAKEKKRRAVKQGIDVWEGNV